MHVEVLNNYCQVKRFDSPKEEALLFDTLRVMVPGYQYMPIYKQGRWDGSKCFYHRNSRRFPSGFLELIRHEFALNHMDVTLIDSRDIKSFPMAIPKKLQAILRDYQREEIHRVMSNRLSGTKLPWMRGILRHPTASGKTLTAIGLIETIGEPTLYLVERRRLLHQFAEQYNQFTGKHCGMIGDGLYSLQKVTIGSAPSVYTRLAEPGLLNYLHSVRAVFVDECFAGDTLIDGPYGPRPIRSLKAGDAVYAYDHTRVEVAIGTVSQTFCLPHERSIMQRIRIQGAPVSLVSTMDHKVWNQAQAAYTAVTKNMALKCLSADIPSGSTTFVQDVEYLPGDLLCPEGLVYDLEVAGYHNYFAGGILVHNCHHIKSGRYPEVMQECVSADIRLGLSGTPLSRGDLGDFYLIGMTGEIISQLQRDTLEDQGFISRVQVKFLQITTGEGRYLPYPAAYSQLIVENEARNRLITKLAVREVNQRQARILILVKHIWHGEILEELFTHTTVRAVFMHGTMSSDEQSRLLKEFASGTLPVIIATAIFDEGVDIPTANCLINAAAGESQIKTIQRVGRVVRPKEDGSIATVYDFLDVDNHYLLKHSRSRMATYKAEKFDVV